MPTTSACCSPQELKAFRAGELPYAKEEAVRAHLQNCRSCREQLHQAQEADPTVISQPASAPTPSPGSNSAVSYGDEGVQVDPVTLLAAPEEPGELGRLGPYRVLKELGRGGMGLVFEAEDPQLRRRLALKVMLPNLAADPIFRRRFLREAQAMAAVDHEHIVPVFQTGLAKGPSGQDVLFLAMPLLHGESLEARLIRVGKLSVAVAVRIARQTAEALAAAHARGLIHRDIKPANIFLEGARGRVRVLDFGLARLADAGGNISAAGQFLGTPYYMAPEQAAGESVDGRSDLFSLGCILYVMLTGRRPFDGTSAMAVLTALAVKEPPPLLSLAPETPAAVAELVHQLLAKQPDRRPASADALAETLEALQLMVGPGFPGSSARPAPIPPPAIAPGATTTPSDAAPARAPADSAVGAAPGSMIPRTWLAWLALLGVGVAAVGALVGWLLGRLSR